MKLLIDSVTKDLSVWLSAFRKELGEDQVVTFAEMTDPDSITTAVVWNHRKDLFEHIPNVKLISSLGAGVDHILRDPLIPKGAQITRVISEHLSTPMSNYCIGAVLHYKKQFDKYLEDKGQKVWHQQFDPERQIKVGVLGLGVLGQDLAKKLLYLGIPTVGMSQSRKEIPGVESYVMEEMEQFLKQINVLICMLPATTVTRQILSMQLFSRMNKGSFLINVARGHHQVNEDIITALDRGILSGVFLDVFPVEPLPQNSPLWTHPKVMITPHIAVVTRIEAAVPAIVKNHRNILKNKPLSGLVDQDKGY